MVMLTISPALWAEMVGHVQRVYPYEGCGFLGGTKHGRVQQVYPIPNQSHSSTHFLMHPGAQLQAWYALHEAGQTLLAIYHSHPHTAAFPSPTDQAEHYYPHVLQLIISLAVFDQPQARAFRVTTSQVEEVTFRLA